MILYGPARCLLLQLRGPYAQIQVCKQFSHLPAPVPDGHILLSHTVPPDSVVDMEWKAPITNTAKHEQALGQLIGCIHRYFSNHPDAQETFALLGDVQHVRVIKATR